MNKNNCNNSVDDLIKPTVEDVPMEVLVRILEFTIDGFQTKKTDDVKMLESVKSTCPKWQNITENICFWREIFGTKLFVSLI